MSWTYPARWRKALRRHGAAGDRAVIVARHIVRKRPSFRTVAVPLPLTGTPLELRWRNAQRNDEALRFIRQHIARIAKVEGSKVSERARSRDA